MLADQDQARARKHPAVTIDQAVAPDESPIFDEKVVLAVPKGRILKELRPVLITSESLSGSRMANESI